MSLTEQQIKVISDRPFNDTLNHIQDKLRDFNEPDDLRQEDIASLLGALVASPAAFSLLSPDESGSVAVRLLSILQAPDIDIWNAVLRLIDTLSSLTPPPSSIVPTYNGTPVKTSSSRLDDSETRDIVEGELFFEIKDCTFRNVGGFCDKFFDSKSWRKEQKEMLTRMMMAHDGKKWMDFPSTPDEKPVWTWLCALEERFLTDAPHKLYTTRTANQFKERKGQMDLFFQTTDRETNSTFTYKDVLVVGEQKKSHDTSRFKADILQLARYALVGYATMSDDAMGLDAFIEREEGHRYATLEDVSGNETRVTLEELIVRQRAIRKPEGDHLKLAGEKGVKGVARVVAHRQITTIADMRKGLEFPKSHRFRDEDVHFRDLPSARPPSKSQKPKLVKEFKEQLSIGKTKPSLYTSRSEDPFENRIYSCLVVSPAGRVISDFKSIRELLESLRDAIRAHQSLYIDGNILHRDISSNNIIITGSKTVDGFKGMLIDLDLAKVRDSGPSGARHQTGTMQFMAIEVLRKADHTYRHDLESFFYVLLWMCGRESWERGGFGQGEEPPKESLLRAWEIGSFQSIASAKVGHMTINGLEEIMNQFPPVFDVVKPLCLKIRTLLFGETARLDIGTPAGDPDQLYNAIRIAYDEAIDKLLKD
ncbi:kinase [Hirsutella rhossiliensis]|uniref:EKC/KEOPS complex subunit BUD32 n=1 Tax=Hirsutella rhossiliensis TaxID=111463 RepID=A0A9P8N8A4_9HYPO|nr:kinase [Hirsutella rhossiliensis]KAH0968807.1 kinase [Hirsutella rhossiliensis]